MSRSNTIPKRSRALVKARDRFRCVRCGMPAPEGQWHHRRSRSVRDVHTHCSCNGIWLCPTCHHWAHMNPTAARGEGLILPRFTMEPWLSPFLSPIGWLLPDCDGGWREAL
jgi:hypothetical protein